MFCFNKKLKEEIKLLKDSNKELQKKLELLTRNKDPYSIALELKEIKEQEIVCLDQLVCPVCSNSLSVSHVFSENFTDNTFLCSSCGFTKETFDM